MKFERVQARAFGRFEDFDSGSTPLGALNVVVSIYYYFQIVVAMFIQTEHQPAPLSFSRGVVLTLLITGLMTLLIGIYPQPFIDLARTAGLPLI